MKTIKTVLVTMGAGMALLLGTTACVSVHDHPRHEEVIVHPHPEPERVIVVPDDRR